MNEGTTPNPTAEQILWELYPDDVMDHNRRANCHLFLEQLRAHGLLSEGAPSEEQIEAAAKALHETRNPWFAAYGDWGAAGFEIKQAFRESARAALEAAARAAQGAAPKAAKDIHEPNHDRVYCVRCGGSWPCQPAQVLPSSGVDEDALAEVIRVEMSRGSYQMTPNEEPYATSAALIARAVVEHLRGER